jgi:hypothetical protein
LLPQDGASHCGKVKSRRKLIRARGSNFRVPQPQGVQRDKEGLAGAGGWSTGAGAMDHRMMSEPMKMSEGASEAAMGYGKATESMHGLMMIDAQTEEIEELTTWIEAHAAQ